jgi:tetratricopeptide (TPR) repeat protein
MNLEWLAQAEKESGGLPAWWPVIALVVPLVITLIVALINRSGAIKVAKIQTEPKAAVPDLAQEVSRILGEELDKRLGPDQSTKAQEAFEQGRREADIAAKELLEKHAQTIHELQAQLAATQQESASQEPAGTAAVRLFNHGREVHLKGELAQAVGLYTAAILLDEEMSVTYYNRGNARFDLGQKAEALADYEKTAELDPASWQAVYNAGNTRYDLGQKEEAIRDYSESIRLNPSWPHAFYNRGNAKSDLGDLNGAISDYEAVIAMDPAFSAAFYNRACQLAKSGRGDAALESLRAAIELDPIRWRKEAKVDPDFDSIDQHPGFRALVD